MSFTPYLNQYYEKIKANHLKYGTLFEDDEFPACDASIYKFQSPSHKVIWMRPYEIVDNPKFIVDQIVPQDLDQGALGNS